MRRDDWLLLAVAAAEGKGLSPVQLQKALFLIGQAPRVKRATFYAFRAYHYGPFSRAIYDDAERLAERGMLEVLEPPGCSWKEYAISPLGAERARELGASLPKALVDYVRQIVEFVRGQTFNQLIRAIYEQFPEYRANSVFQG